MVAELGRDAQSVFNRVHSISEDALFVDQVHRHYAHLPLLPNLRCGAWYTNPEISSAERAYFKSTDGHTNNWSFSLRRPNLHLLPLLVQHAGLVLVDSTRAGKRIPDALSKTVPIWCSVINRVINIKRADRLDTALYTPPGSVSPQEHSQIELKLDEWAAKLAASSYQLPDLDLPLRPIWITPATTVFPTFPRPPLCTFYPIICVSASKQVPDGLERRAPGYAYIQGAGDDHELWAMGLTPTTFWRHYDEILAKGPHDLPGFVCSIVADAHHNGGDTIPLSVTPIEHVSGRISICNMASLGSNVLRILEDTALLCLTPASPIHQIGELGTSALCIQTPDGKKGQRHFLTAVLPRSMQFIQYHLQNQYSVCISCSTGADISVGVAVAALALFFHSDGSFKQEKERDGISKDLLKTRLQWIISSYPQANPSRTTLKRVNDFLLSPLPNRPIMLNSVPTNTPELDDG